MQAAEHDNLVTLRERLRGHLDGLSRQQRKIADYLLDHAQEIPFLTVPLLAEHTGASEATVVRLCQRIGYRGFAELKFALLEDLRREPVTDALAGAVPAGDAQRSLELVAEQDRHNLAQTLEGIDREAFRKAAAALFQADHIYTWGIGISAHLASLAAYLFTEHGLRAHALDHRFSTPSEPLQVLRKGDLVLAFSFPPYSRETLEVLEVSRERGGMTMAITDRLSAPAAVRADHALAAASDGVMLGNSVTTSCLLLNALLLEIAFAHRGETVEALARINQLYRASDRLMAED